MWRLCARARSCQVVSSTLNPNLRLIPSAAWIQAIRAVQMFSIRPAQKIAVKRINERNKLLHRPLFGRFVSHGGVTQESALLAVDITRK